MLTNSITPKGTVQGGEKLPAGVPPLRTFYMYLTAGCNLACQHCWLAPRYQPDGGTGGHLDFDLFKLAIDEAIPLGLQGVKLTGGEPLLHPDFVRMLDYLKEKSIGLTVETNGTLLTEQLATYLKEKTTLGFISVSLDGAVPETHDSFRSVRGSYAKAVQAVKNLAAVGYRPQIIMSLHLGNVDEIEPLVKLAEEWGAGSVKFNLIQSTGRGEGLTEKGRTLGIERLVELGRWVEGTLQKTTPVKLYYSWPMAFYSIRRLVNDGSGSCGIFTILGILPDGKMAMCGIGEEIPALCYGQLGVDSLAQVWAENQTLRFIRENIPGELEGICGKCMFKVQCLGSCIADNYHQSGRLTAPFWFCAEAEKLNLFSLTRILIR